MRFSIKSFSIFMVALFLVLGCSSTNAQRKYVGAKMCGACHKGEKNKNVFEKWTASAHSKAFETLKTPKAMEVAKKKGIAKPTEDPGCLSCHATNGGNGAGVKKEEGVTCEACHGAGSEYMAKNVMQNRELALKKGMILGSKDADLCKKCHNQKSPTYKPFAYAKDWEKIKHPSK